MMTLLWIACGIIIGWLTALGLLTLAFFIAGRLPDVAELSPYEPSEHIALPDVGDYG